MIGNARVIIVDDDTLFKRIEEAMIEAGRRIQKASEALGECDTPYTTNNVPRLEQEESVLKPHKTYQQLTKRKRWQK